MNVKFAIHFGSDLEVLSIKDSHFSKLIESCFMVLNCNIVSVQVDGDAAQKKGTAQLFRLANSARIFINLCWYHIAVYIVI